MNHRIVLIESVVHFGSRTLRRTFCWLIILGLCFLFWGCTRGQYRASADKRSYQLIRSRLVDPRWSLPARAVEPPQQSRMSLLSNLDCSPKPPDDPAAVCLMYHPDGHCNHRYWSKIPTANKIDSPVWLDYLPRGEDGEINLTQQLTVDLALLHSREYQTQFENVYLNALSLTGNQFEFATQWAGGTGTQYSVSGADLGNNRLLEVSDHLGFGRNLAGGGQFAINFLNSFFWDFGSNGTSGAGGQLVTSFTQPLLRGAFRHVRLETLTQAERNLLYHVRDFAHFRRQFYLNNTSSYLNLLTQVQSIRNAQTNLDSLQLNLTEHEELSARGMVAQIQIDQVFQDYQNGRLSLLSAEQNLTASLDQFKFQLGLPAWTPLKIDQSLLASFELADPHIAEIQDKTQLLYQRLVQFLPPEVAPRELLIESFDEYRRLRKEVASLLPNIQGELAAWTSRIERSGKSKLSHDDQIDLGQQKELARRVSARLTELETTLSGRDSFDGEIQQLIDRYGGTAASGVDIISPNRSLNSAPATGTTQNGQPQSAPQSNASDRPEFLAWKGLQSAIGNELREEISDLYIAQTQIRLFLIDIEPLEIDERAAISYAHQNRLDQMNRQAQVMDAFRKIEVAADALQSQLNVSGQIGLGSDPNHNNAFRLDSSSNTYRVGVQFDGPLNRLNERNVYRATQIAYQQATRSYLAGRDTIAIEVRSSLRQLKLRRLSFQIARQQLVAATRQVDQAQVNLRKANQSNTNLTRDLLQALQGLLNAKNNLIFNWIDYKIAKIRLFTALELLYLDDNGNWSNEEFSLAELSELVTEDDYFPPEAPLVIEKVELASEVDPFQIEKGQ